MRRFRGNIGHDRLGRNFVLAIPAQRIELSVHDLGFFRSALDGKNQTGPVAAQIGSGELLGKRVAADHHLEREDGEKIAGQSGGGGGGVFGEELLDQFGSFVRGQNEVKLKFHFGVRFFPVHHLDQVMAARGQGVFETDGGVGQELEGVEKIGFAGVVASGQPDHVVQTVQFDAFDASIIANDKTLQFKVEQFHCCPSS